MVLLHLLKNNKVNIMVNVFVKFVLVVKIDVHLNKYMLIHNIIILLINNHIKNGK